MLLLGAVTENAVGQTVKTIPRSQPVPAGPTGSDEQVAMEFDSVSGLWVMLDSATLVQRQRERWI